MTDFTNHRRTASRSRCSHSQALFGGQCRSFAFDLPQNLEVLALIHSVIPGRLSSEHLPARHFTHISCG